MRSKGSRFTLGVWGLRVCSLDVAFTFSQPFATVRAIPVWPCLLVSSAGGVIFGCFQRFVASFRVVGVALCDIQTCSVTRRKSFLCGRRNTFCDVSEDTWQFSWQAQAFWTCPSPFFVCRRSTLDVSCWVFFANGIGRAASSGDKVQVPWQTWHFVTYAEKLTDASHETSILRLQNLEVPRKTRRKPSILKPTKCENWRKSRTKCLFWCSRVSRLESLVFPWLCRVYGGSCKTCPFVMLPTVKIAGSLVRNAGFSASTCLVSSRWFSCGVAVSMGEAGKPLLLECVQAGCHVVLRGRRGHFVTFQPV